MPTGKSKYCLLLRSSTAGKVIQWLENHVFLIYGVPDRLIADNGPQFRSKILRDMLGRYGVKLCFTANYHPQANPVERVHRVLKTIISGYVEDNHKNGDKFLAKAGCAIRSSTHEVTGTTPNFIMFGREPSFLDLKRLRLSLSQRTNMTFQCHAALLRRV